MFPKFVVSRERFPVGMDHLERRTLLTTFAVTNTANSGGGSLRQAILNANASVGADTIIFSIGAGIRTIAPLTPLPSITDPVTVDATTQPGYAGINPFIQLRGDSLGAPGVGLDIAANGCLVKGLNVCLFETGISIGGSNNAVESCYVGTDLLGLGTLSNTYGIVVSGSGNRIGVGPGQSAAARNVISGNIYSAISLYGGNNVVTGNYIGINFDGTAKLASGSFGILMQNAPGNLIGSPEPNRRNVITGNYQAINMTSCDSTIIQANYLGVSPAGEAYAGGGNSSTGIFMDACEDVRIGLPGAGNVISGNGSYGISITPGSTCFNLIIESNFIGTNAAGSVAVPNVTGSASGSGVSGAHDAAIIRNNLVSGNAGYGLDRFVNVIAVGNKIGTDVTGSYAIPNQLGGINRPLLFAADLNTRIGGSSPGEGNLISGNGGPGISLTGGSSGTILGNKIGTNLAGTVALANQVAGIYVAAPLVTVGGTTAAERNLISGNPIGIQVTDSTATGIAIRGNWIGLRGDGIAALPNGIGIFIGNGAHDNEIGGTSVGAGNVISGNLSDGVNIKPNSNGTRFLNNRIGTDASGAAAVPNQSAGIGVQVSSVEIGAIGPLGESLGNTISGNLSDGIRFYGGTALDTSLVRANRIGVAADGVAAMPNGGAGIRFETTAGRVSITSGNVIQNNGGAGVAIAPSAGTGIEIFGNSIYRNGGLGIDLNDDGVTINGPNPRPGPNGMTNFPDLVNVATSGGRTILSGSYSGLLNTLYALDFYSSPDGDASSYGEGASPIHTQLILTDASGFATFAVTLAIALPNNSAVTATASRGANTSEFSKWNTVVDSLGPRVTGSEFLYETAPLKLLVKFDEDVSATMSPSAFSVTRIGGSGTVPITAVSWNSSTLTATLTLGTIPPDGNYRLTALAGSIHDSFGNALDGNGDDVPGDSYTFDFFVLAGDANRDRTVNFDDLLIIAQHYGQTGRTFSQGNFTYDAAGVVNFDDLLLIAQRYGSSVLTTGDELPSRRRQKQGHALVLDE